jgi:hypothetical protein
LLGSVGKIGLIGVWASAGSAAHANSDPSSNRIPYPRSLSLTASIHAAVPLWVNIGVGALTRIGPFDRQNCPPARVAFPAAQPGRQVQHARMGWEAKPLRQPDRRDQLVMAARAALDTHKVAGADIGNASGKEGDHLALENSGEPPHDLLSAQVSLPKDNRLPIERNAIVQQECALPISRAVDLDE